MGKVARSLRLHGGLPAGIAITVDNALKEVLNVQMDDAADVTGGGTTQTVGFTVVDFVGDPIDYPVKLQFAAFDDAGLAADANAASLSTAAEGTILTGGGSAALKVETDSNGRFSCTLTNPMDTTVFLGCSMDFGSPVIDCRQIDSVSFS